MFKKGDRVICINEVRPVFRNKPMRVVAGDEYIVTKSYTSFGLNMIHLEEVKMDYKGKNVHIPYRADRFIIKNNNNETE